jgi:hypothetical protein
VGGGDHRCGAFVDGVDDLGVVDPAQIHRGDRKVGVAELALDDEQGTPSRDISTAWACLSW